MKKRIKQGLLLLLCLCLGMAFAACDLPRGASANEPVLTDGLEVFFLDVGQADAAVLCCGDEVMMIDGGNRADSDFIYAWLQQHEIDEIDRMVCTHAHEDHVGGLPGALNYAAVKAAYAPVTDAESKVFQNYLTYLQQQDCPLTVPQPGDEFPLGEAEVEILGPVKSYSDTNNTSIVLKVTYGQTSFLFTGDMEQDAEEDLLWSGCDLSATVLKVGHHGSHTSTSEAFLQAVSPEYGVISVGKDNDYGHPSQEVLDRLSRAGTTVYRTDLSGTIHCTSDGKTVSFETEKEGGVSEPATQTEQPSEQQYIGNRNSKKFHLPSCSGLPKEENRIYFTDRQDAVDAGYTPCGQCKP